MNVHSESLRTTRPVVVMAAGSGERMVIQSLAGSVVVTVVEGDRAASIELGAEDAGALLAHVVDHVAEEWPTVAPSVARSNDAAIRDLAERFDRTAAELAEVRVQAHDLRRQLMSALAAENRARAELAATRKGAS